MTRIAIVTDSTAGLPYDLFAENNIYEVPLNISWGDNESYKDRVEMDPTAFYQRLATTTDLPTTSQPSIGDFAAQFQKLAADYDTIVAVLISGDLSGTVDSATAAAAQCDNVPVYVIDSRFTSLAQGFMVLEVARLLREGMPIPELLQAAETIKGRLIAHFFVDTLEFLRRGGRMGGATALIGTTLKIHPILQITDGHIDILKRVHTRKRAIQQLLQSVVDRVDPNKPVQVGVVHANDLQGAEQVAALVQKRLQTERLLVSELSPVIGTHVGPGTIGLLAYQRL